MVTKKRKVAVFDIDGTIFRSSLLVELVDQLIAGGVFPASAEKVYAKAYKDWLDRKGSYDAYIMAVVESFSRHIQGVREKDFLKAVERVHLFHKNRVYRFTRDLVKDLKRKGYFLLAISHSPKYIVEGFAKSLGFNKVYGRYLELDTKGIFTGTVLYEDVIADKAQVLGRALHKEGLTLRGSVGVGDTDSDVSFLKLVERPICFNPNKELYTIAVREGWEVVVERKDMIYKLPKG